MNPPATQLTGLDPELSGDPDYSQGTVAGANSASVFLMTNSFETGGSERQFVDLARALQPSKYRVNLGCLQANGPLQANLGPVEHFDLGGSLYRLQSMRTRYRLAGYLRRTEVAVAHAFDFYTNLALIPAAKMARTPVVIGSQRQLGDLLSPNQRRYHGTLTCRRPAFHAGCR